MIVITTIVSLSHSDITGSIGKRYHLLEQIGEGKMGVVYRAFDRLKREIIALKRVLVKSAFPQDSSSGTDEDLRLLLTREFQSLASLRHPNIIKVHDYGFDAERQPYFTMELLPDAQTIVQAGASQPDKVKADLLLQMLYALTYLHRRGIIHRDLKPANVLVSYNQVKVLDFGISVGVGEGGDVSGTLAYLAPEILENGLASISSDLYAVGTMAYELFAGHHPFDTSGLSALLDGILNEAPNVNLPSIPPVIAQILMRLLAKAPEERYVDAADTTRALSEAIGMSLPQETQEIRESFLQAAQFVGRETEMVQLDEALDETIDGRGTAWLVGGESGVGKTRLINEVRIRALVKGALILRGQAVREGGRPYQLWTGVISWLAMLAEPDVLQAGVLKTLVPDIESLLDEVVPDAPELEPEAAQTRLLTVITELVKQRAAQSPIVILLEDLQWARANSVGLLRRLSQILLRESVPLLILGTYRNDERPELPIELPEMHPLMLGRLSEDAVATLSESILGIAGQQPQIVNFLQRETEGNTFFIVEVIRALAEKVGQLDQIGQVPLPTNVFAGGIQRVIERRLSRVPVEAEPLLQLAAVAGREIDLAVLASAAPEQDVERWLTNCMNAAVIDIEAERWHFAYDKLRQGVLESLAVERRKVLHQKIGGAIEQVYASDLASHAADLAYHYGRAEDTVQEHQYARLAGEQAAAQFANDEALTYFSRALDLTPESNYVERYALLLACEKIYGLQGKREDQLRALETLEEMVKDLNDVHKRAEVVLRRSTYAEATSDYPLAITAAQTAIGLAQASGDLYREAQGYHHWGQALWRQGNYEAAQTQLLHALSLAAGVPVLKAQSLRTLGLISWNQGDFTKAGAYFEMSQVICRQIGDRQVEGNVLNNLGIISAQQGDYSRAIDNFEQSLLIVRQIGNRQVEANILNNLGNVVGRQGDYSRAKTYYEQALLIKREIDDRHGQGMVLDNLGNVSKYQGDYPEAINYLEASHLIRQEVGDQQGEGNVLNNLGNVSHYQGDYAAAREYYKQSLLIRREIGDRQGESEGLAYLSLLAHHQDDDKASLEYGKQALQIAEDLGDRHLLGYALTHLGHALAGVEDLVEATAAYQKALDIRRELGDHYRAVEPLAGLADINLTEGNFEQAQVYVEEILSFLESTIPSSPSVGFSLDGTEEPLWVLLTCYRVLYANQDSRAEDILAAAYRFLQDRAAKITNEEMRHSFLNNVASHRELVAMGTVMNKNE